MEGDPLADTLVLELLQHPSWAETINSWVREIPSESQLPAYSEAFAAYFLSFSETMPDLDEKKVRYAQQFFDQQGEDYLTLLGLYSLPYCYAFADGAQVLIRSKRITEEVGLRLMETALFLIDCFRPGSFLEDRQVMLTLSKVRLIHAFSRYFVQKYATDWKPEWGTPINQEDLIGTNLAFSMLVIRGLDKLGKPPGTKAYEAILHYWKIIGFHLGLKLEAWPENSKEAFELERLIRKRHMRASDAGKQLMKSLLQYYQQAFKEPTMNSLVGELIAFLVGKDAASALGLTTGQRLPKEAYSLMLQWSILQRKSFSNASSYAAIRSQFESQSAAFLGKSVQLQVPVIKRP
jgi:hypothetical protein